MMNIHVRACLPAFLIQLFIALTVSHTAFSQETQTAPAARPAQKVEAMVEKTATEDVACEQTPAATTHRTSHPSLEQHDAREATIFKSQPLRFASLRELNPRGQQAGAPTIMPLTPGEKMKRAAKSAFLSPQAFILPGVSAILTEAGEDDLPHKDTDDRVADGLSRFAIIFGRRSTIVLLSHGVYASLFRQDPRYYPSESKNFGARALYAASRVFVTRGDDGKLQPNYSRFAGQLSASALSNLWEQSTPGHDRIGTDATFRRYGYSFASGAAFNILNEFLPDLKKMFKK